MEDIPAGETRPEGKPDAGPETSRKRGPHPDAGKYVVLAAKPTQGGAGGVEPGSFEPVGSPIVAKSAREAKAKAIEQNETLASAVRGDGAFLAAVPAMSWQPALVKAEQPPPILSGL